MENNKDNQMLNREGASDLTLEVMSETGSAVISDGGTENRMEMADEIASGKKTPFKGPESVKSFTSGILVGVVAVLLIGLIFRVTSKEFQILFLINQYALTDATPDDVQNGKYKGMLSALDDKYAAYYSVQETSKTKQEKSGTYIGIGVVLAQDPDTGVFYIQGVYEGSSAAENGVEPGDILTELNHTWVDGMAVEELSSKIAGMGSRVPLTFKRGEETYEVTLEVKEVEVPKVYHTLLEKGIGYIAMDKFIMTTGRQFAAAVDELETQGMKALIVDLRGNGGGLVDTAVEALDRILPEGTAVYTMDKNEKRYDYKVKGKTPLDIPLVILVDGSTASASEIFAGACRDRLDTKLIGTKTYGKGIVQTTYSLLDNSSVRFTTSHYYTPNGTDINGNGLEPDIEAVPTPLDGEKTVMAMSEQDTPFREAVAYLEDRLDD